MTFKLPYAVPRSPRAAVRLASTAALALVALVALVPGGRAAAAAAQVTPFSFTVQETFQDAPPECMPMLKSGVTTATERVSGQIVETENGTSIHATGLFVYRTDFADGSYLTGAAHDHFTFADHHGKTVTTDVIREPRTVYSSDGIAIGRVTIHALTHFTTDNATGTTSASIDRFFFTCS